MSRENSPQKTALIILSTARMLIYLMALASLLTPAHAGNSMDIRAEVINTLRLKILTTSLDWILSADASPYSITLDTSHGIEVYASGGHGYATWTLYVRGESSNLTDWDGSKYGIRALKSPLSITSLLDAGVGIGHTVTITTNNQELITNGVKNGKANQIGVTYTQPVSWLDEPLPTGHKYRNVLTFTAIMNG